MRYLLMIGFAVLISCSTKPIHVIPPLTGHPTGVDWSEVDGSISERIPESGRVCDKSDWRKQKTVEDVFVGSTFYVVTHRIANGKNKGYWHNPKGGWARIFYDLNDVPFLWFSYNVQVNEDVVQKGKTTTRYPATIKLRDGVRTIVHKQNSWETDITASDGNFPAVLKLDAITGETICEGHYDCDLHISGCHY